MTSDGPQRAGREPGDAGPGDAPYGSEPIHGQPVSLGPAAPPPIAPSVRATASVPGIRPTTEPASAGEAHPAPGQFSPAAGQAAPTFPPLFPPAGTESSAFAPGSPAAASPPPYPPDPAAAPPPYAPDPAAAPPPYPAPPAPAMPSFPPPRPITPFGSPAGNPYESSNGGRQADDASAGSPPDLAPPPAPYAPPPAPYAPPPAPYAPPPPPAAYAPPPAFPANDGVEAEGAPQRAEQPADLPQRGSAAARTGRTASGSASVPMTNRVSPDDPPLPPTALPAPQPRVYGRAVVDPAGAEPPAEARPPFQGSGPGGYGDPAVPRQPQADRPGRPGEPSTGAGAFDFAQPSGPSLFTPASAAGTASVRQPDVAPASPPGVAPAPPPPAVPPPAPALPSWPVSYSGSASMPPAGVSPAGPPPGGAGMGFRPPLGDLPPFDAFGVNSPGSPGQAPGTTYGEPASTTSAPPAAAAAPPAGEEQPTPQVRNGRVLLAVLCAAVLLLVVPLGIVWLATRSSDVSFEVGSCVRQSGSGAVAADCDDANAYVVVSKVDNQEKCTNPPNQPYVVIDDGGKDNVLCLRPANGK